MTDTVVDTIWTAGWREGAAGATLLQVRWENLKKMVAPAGTPKPLGPTELRPPPSEDPADPTIGKWAAVVLEQDKDAAVGALEPLIAHRRGRNCLWKDGVIVLSPSKTRTPESWQRKLKRAIGKASPPHYLLLVGGVDRFPFEFQHELDLHLIAGRLDASDVPDGPFSWDACRRYAEKVVAYERGEIGMTAKPLFYSLNRDEKTRFAHDHLVLKLSQKIPGGVTELYGSDATADGLMAKLAAKAAPKLVFTASHGVEFPVDPRQWGALTTFAHRGRADDELVSAERVNKESSCGHGSIIFTFACFSAGVPERSQVDFLVGKSDAGVPMVARTAPLPRQLLGASMGPVAFVGHVDRVSAAAFQSSFGLAGIEPFDHFIAWLRQEPVTVGRALETMRESARLVGARIAGALVRASESENNIATLREAGRKWVGFYDYRGFILLGDPAVTVTTP